MTCRHAPGDPECSSTVGGPAWQRERDYHSRLQREQLEKREKELLARTPNPDEFEIVQVEQVGAHLVVMAQYSSCTKCSFDAKKVMVFLDTTVKDVVFWKRLDPHFQEPPKPGARPNPKHAPAPRARFPADDAGWQDAMDFARSKQVRLASDG